MPSDQGESMEERFDRIDKTLTALTTDVNTLKTDVNTLKTDVNTLKTDVSTLKTDVSTLKTDVSTLKTDMSDLKNDMNKVKVQVEQMPDLIQKAAEGYGGALEAIHRELAAIRVGCHDKWTLHDRVLKNHGKRIAALEAAKLK